MHGPADVLDRIRELLTARGDRSLEIDTGREDFSAWEALLEVIFDPIEIVHSLQVAGNHFTEAEDAVRKNDLHHCPFTVGGTQS